MNPMAHISTAGAMGSPFTRRMSVPVINPMIRSKPKHFLELLDHSNETLHNLAERAKAGLLNEKGPELCEDGVGGVYFMKDASGSRIAVFKPQDEEPFNANNPKGFRPRRNSLSSFKEGILIGEASVREASAFLLDHGNWAGIPPTGLAFCEHPAFYLTQEPAGEDVGINVKNQGKKKLGSFQKYIVHDGNTEDKSMSLISQFPLDEVHKIAVLDIRLFNTDRHGGNILYSESVDDEGNTRYTLIPIDHGYTIPSTLGEAWFAWQHWPQAKQKMSEKTLQYIQELDVERDIKILLEQFPRAFRKEHFKVLRISYMLLKSGAQSGLSLFQISNFMCRLDLNTPSLLEQLCEQANERSQGNDDKFWHHLHYLMDAEIQTVLKAATEPK